jgi:exonuclease III
MQQEPNQPPVTQPTKESVDDKIAAITNEVYSFEHGKEKHSLIDRFRALPKTKKVITIVSVCGILFVGILVGITFMSGGFQQKTNTNVTTSNGGSSKDNLTEYQTDDVNGDGIIDQYDVNAISDTAVDTSGSWWQKIISAGKTASTTSDDGSSYSDTNVAFEDNQPASNPSSSDDGGSGDGGVEYYEEDEGDADDSDYDSSDPTNIPITEGPTAGTTIPAGGANVTFASWNTLFSNSTSNIGKGVKAVGNKADIIGFQELHNADRRKKMRDALLCSSCDFSGYVQNYSTSGSSPGSVAIVWRKSLFKVVKSGYYKVSDRQNIDTHNGITGSKISAKWITWVLLTDKRTNAQFYFLNTHTVASVESKGKPISGEKDRLKLYDRHMDVLTSKVSAFRATGLPVFITGDFNVNYRYDHTVQYKNFPFTRLGAVGAHSDYQRLNLASIPKSQPSHGSGNRIIDYVWYTNSTSVYPISESISTARYGSDHYPVYFTANVR